MIISRAMRLAVYGACAFLTLAATRGAGPVAASIVPHLAVGHDGSHNIVVRFTIDPQWHLYWSNPGDSGIAPTVKLTLPAGWTASEPIFPRPQVFGTSKDRTYGYSSSLDLLVPVTAAAGDTATSIAVTASIEWMTCKGSVCVFGKFDGPAQVSTQAVPIAGLSIVRAYPSKLPPSISTTFEGMLTAPTLVISAAASAGIEGMRFIPDSVAGIEFLDGTGPMIAKISGERVAIRIPFAVHLADAVDGPPRLRGLLLTGSKDSDSTYRIDLALPDVPAKAK